MKRKKILTLVTFVLLSACLSGTLSAKSRTFKPGALWPDNRGIHINAHGGGILHYKGMYYWFGEHKSDTTSSAMVGVTCYRSRNLADWRYCGVALSVSDSVGSDIERGCILERPKVIYNTRTNKFVMWFHLELKGKGYQAARYGVAVSDKPEGPYCYLRSGRVNAGCYPMEMAAADKEAAAKLNVEDYKKSWTPQWHDAVERGLFFNRDFANGQMARDQTVFVDDDGKAYHIFSSEENMTLDIAELTDDYTAHTGRFTRVAEGGQNEAPAIFKHNGTYWMITSGCTGWEPNNARMFSATNIWGPWKQLPSPCRGQNAKTTFGGQSTYILKVDGSKDLFIFMADIWRPKNPIDARYVWLPIRFEGGIPVIKWADEWKLNKK